MTPSWHSMEGKDALRLLRSSPDGLVGRDAAARLARDGANVLPVPPRRSLWRRLFSQFHSALIYVLLGSAILAGLLGHAVDAVVILIVVLLNAAIGHLQESRAERALEAIGRMIAPRASLLREGRRTTVAAAELVCGDVVLLEPGDRVPADVRLLHANNLCIDESMLTGESVAAEKSSAPVLASVALADRRSMAYSGTMVLSGQGTGLVVATGAATEIGRIGALLGSVQTLSTPLVQQMDRFGRQLSLAIVGLAAAVFALAVWGRDYAVGEAFMTVVALTVAAIPEGLPAVLTITLAVGVQRMARRHAIIRRLPAVETLGVVSVICSDKTGTLTRNEMTVRSVATNGLCYEVCGAGYEPHGAVRAGGTDVDPQDHPALQEMAGAALLCGDARLWQSDGAWRVDGDPMEGALVCLARKTGCDEDQLRREFRRIGEIPFDARYRWMATLHQAPGERVLAYVKGAPEQVLEMCTAEKRGSLTVPIDHEAWRARSHALAAQGQRVLAVALRQMPSATRSLRPADVERGLVLLGVCGLLDPPRDEAIAAVRACRDAGIEVKMVTGDHAVTAKAIATQLGIAGTAPVVTGQQLDQTTDPELGALAAAGAVFARTTPEHKLRLVMALQKRGAVVAMTGDGVNDAPALKRADIGVAMGGKGTEAAKEAAEMVLTDDNFASIVAAVREGRTVYDNLKKVIGWTLPTNGGEAFTIVAAILFGLTLPVTPLQILWINMVTAVALGLTLAFEPTEEATMRRTPRPAAEPLLSGFLLWRIALVSLLFVAGTFGVFRWALERGEPLETARTMATNTIVVMEIFYLFSVRYVHGRSLTWRGVLGTPAVLIGVTGVTLAQLALTYVPAIQAVFGTRALDLLHSAVVIAPGIALLLLIETEKLLQRRFRSDAAPREIAVRTSDIAGPSAARRC